MDTAKPPITTTEGIPFDPLALLDTSHSGAEAGPLDPEDMLERQYGVVPDTALIGGAVGAAITPGVLAEVPAGDAEPDNLWGLVERFQQGGEDGQKAFAEIYRQTRASLMMFVFVRMRGSNDIEDVVMETYEKAYARMRELMPGTVLGWLYTVAHRTIIDRWKSSHARRQQVADPTVLAESDLGLWRQHSTEDSPWRSVEGAALHGITRSKLFEAIAKLRTDQRACVIAFYFAGWSQAEIMQRFEFESENAVKSKLHRAIHRLGTIIQAEYPELAPHK